MAAEKSAFDVEGRDRDAYGYPCKMYRGIPYPDFVNLSLVEDLRESFELRDDDIVIATFPKCGTTWMQQIVLLLLNKGDREKVTRPMQQSPWLEEVISRNDDVTCASLMAETGPRRVFKTHAPADLVPWKGGVEGLSTKQKVIIVSRNPFDACVSMFHHTRDTPIFKYNGDWDHFCSLYLEGRVNHGSYWEWCLHWWKAYERHPQNLLWLSFEDLKKDLAGGVNVVAKHINVQLDEAIRSNVVHASSFNAMKKQFNDMDAIDAKEGKEIKPNHIREGRVGGWKAQFTEHQAAAFREKTAKILQEEPALRDIIARST